MKTKFKSRYFLTTALFAASNALGAGAASASTYGIQHTSDDALDVNNGAGEEIVGDKSGIFGQEGPVRVDNAGLIRGNGTYDGFNAEPDSGIVFAVEGSSVVNSGTIIGAGTGVGTAHYYNAATNSLEPRAVGTTVINTGTITGENNDGVRLIGGGTVTNSGAIRGLAGVGADGISMFALTGQNTSGQTAIGTVTNAVGGTISGVRMGTILSGGGVVGNAGSITGANTAVWIQAGQTEQGKTATVTNSGTITGGTGMVLGGYLASSAVSNSGRIEGTGAFGVHNGTAGVLTLENNVAGEIVGAKSGVFAEDGATVLTNAGTIRGNGTYDGLAAAPDAGVLIAAGNSSVTNSGTISGARFGISTAHYFNAATNSLEPRATGTTITNTGTITGDSDDGVRLIGGGSVTNSGTIKGLVGAGADGVSMFALTGQDTSGQASIGTVTNAVGGVISGARFGIILSGGGVIGNAGSITGANTAVWIQAGQTETGKTATITNSGTLTGGIGLVLGGYLASSDVDNSGRIEGTVSYGVHNTTAGTLTLDNAVSGEIVGAKSGVFAEDGAIVLTNAGTIRGNGTYDGLAAAPDAGVLIAAGNSSVTNSGTISGARFGISTAHYFNAATNSLEPRATGTTITNTGTITGDSDDGVRLIGGGSVTNSGTIKGLVGAGADGISMFALTGQDTSGQTSIGTVTNAAGGTISGQRFGIILTGGGVVDNAGTITGSGPAALQIQAVAGDTDRTATVTNSGTINGGVVLFNVTGTVNNSGSILSETGAAFASQGQVALTNSGTITGTGGTAAVLSAFDDTLVLKMGSTVTGAIDGGDGVDTVTLQGTSGTATNTQTVAELANFEQLNVTQGYWTAASPVGAFGQVSIGTNGILDVREVVTPTGSDSPIQTASIVNDGLLVLNFNNTETLTGFDGLTISGSGGVRLEGSGVFEVDGSDLSYTGTTTVANGGLLLTGTLAGDVVTSGNGVFQLGDGGTTGEFTHDLVNNGRFIFNRSDDYDFLGAFSGTGDFTKMGAGTLTFAGDYSYTGITRILAGGVRFAGAIDPTTEIALGSGTLDISGTPQTIAALSGAQGSSIDVDESTLTVDQSTDTAYAGGITGDGALVKEGDGNLNLTGTSSYTGPTDVNGGTLSVNGSITSDVTVNAGGTLGGTGSVGDVTIVGAGTLAPGNSIGTLQVNGNVAFATGSIYEVEVNAAGAADRINATGTATIAQGSTVQVLAETGVYRPRTDYTILTAQGGVTGTFSTVTSNLAFLTPRLNYSANAVSLALYRNDIDFADVATSSNQAGTATAVQGLGIGNALFEAVLVQSESTARSAFDQLSGEIHASIPSALANDSRHVREAIQATMQQDGEEKVRIWGSVLGSWGDADAGQGVAKLDTDHRGLIAGADFGGAGFRAGFAAGVSNSDYDADARTSVADVDTKFVGGHVGYKKGGFAVQLGGALAWHDIQTTRSVNFAGISQTPSARYDATTRQLFAEASYALQAGSFTLAPFARLAHVRTKTEDFTEVAGSAALAIDKGVHKVQFLTLGLHARGDAAAQFQPRLSLGWQHGWGDLRGQTRAAFIGAAGDFSVIGSRLPRDAATVDAGFDVNLGRVRIGASYIGSISSRWSDHGAKATLGVRF